MNLEIVNVPRKSGWAVASLVLGIVGMLTFICTGVVLGLLAAICGHIALSRIKKAAGLVTGHDLAVAGMIMGYLALILMLLLLPPVYDLYIYGKINAASSNGKQIYYAAFARNLEVDAKEVWPSSASYSSSTVFFTNLVGNGVLKTSGLPKVGYSVFAAPGITPYMGSNAALFKAENNAWCVVADLSEESPDTMPFLISRNVRASSLADLHGRIGDTLSDDPPFGRKGVVVILKGGGLWRLRGQGAWNAVFTNAALTNRILRP